MTSVRLGQAKQAVREHVWNLLEEHHAVPQGVHGHIPSFVGADTAARRLATLEHWRRAQTIKANPDRAQLSVRLLALTEERTLYMAVPNLAAERPFYLLDPKTISVSLEDAASSHGAAGHSRQVEVSDMRPIDLIVCGSVAVNRSGVRVGKGAGYSDIEVALLQEAHLIGPQTTIATTVHQLQVLDAQLPATDHDFRVDLIVTPDEVIDCGHNPRPKGILWDHLDHAKIASIPPLSARQEH